MKPALEVGGVFGGVIGSSVDPDGEGESALSSVRESGTSDDDVADDPERCAESRVPRPNAALKCEWWETRGDIPLNDIAAALLSISPIGGLSFRDRRDCAGDNDLSSKEPVIYVSVIDSSEVHGLGCDSELRGGATELMKGTRTESSINSYIILTAGSSSDGSGGVYVHGSDTNRSRTLDGRLTSRGPFGTMYASNNFCHNIRTYSHSGLCGDKGV